MELVRAYDFIFENFILHADGVLTFHGQDVAIPPKELHVLITLLEGHGNLVHKNFIIDQVWGDNLVGDESLTRCIYSLRRLLREAKNNKFIETVYGKGYRFCKAVMQVPRKKKQGVGTRLAIFPFRSAREEVNGLLHAHLLDAINGLALPGVSIVPSVLTRSYDKPADLLMLCKQLGLDYYIAGELYQDGSREQLMLELVDALNQNLLHCATVALGDPPAWPLQMKSAAATLTYRLSLTDFVSATVADNQPMLPPLLARHCVLRRENTDLAQARRYLQQGLTQAPQHLPSLLLQADIHLALAQTGALPTGQALLDARSLLLQVLHAAGGQPQALAMLAWIEGVRRMPLNGANAPQLTLSPLDGSPELSFYRALNFMLQGEADLACQAVSQALLAEPEFEWAQFVRLWLLYASQQDEVLLDQALETPEALSVLPLINSMQALIRLRRQDNESALALAQGAVSLAGGSWPERILLAIVQVKLRQLTVGQEALALWAETPHCPSLLAWLAGSLGDKARMQKLLQQAYQQQCVWWPFVALLPEMRQAMQQLESARLQLGLA